MCWFWDLLRYIRDWGRTAVNWRSLVSNDRSMFILTCIVASILLIAYISFYYISWPIIYFIIGICVGFVILLVGEYLHREWIFFCMNEPAIDRRNLFSDTDAWISLPIGIAAIGILLYIAYEFSSTHWLYCIFGICIFFLTRFVGVYLSRELLSQENQLEDRASTRGHAARHLRSQGHKEKNRLQPHGKDENRSQIRGNGENPSPPHSQGQGIDMEANHLQPHSTGAQHAVVPVVQNAQTALLDLIENVYRQQSLESYLPRTGPTSSDLNEDLPRAQAADTATGMEYRQNIASISSSVPVQPQIRESNLHLSTTHELFDKMLQVGPSESNLSSNRTFRGDFHQSGGREQIAHTCPPATATGSDTQFENASLSNSSVNIGASTSLRRKHACPDIPQQTSRNRESPLILRVTDRDTKGLRHGQNIRPTSTGGRVQMNARKSSQSSSNAEIPFDRSHQNMSSKINPSTSPVKGDFHQSSSCDQNVKMHPPVGTMESSTQFGTISLSNSSANYAENTSQCTKYRRPEFLQRESRNPLKAQVSDSDATGMEHSQNIKPASSDQNREILPRTQCTGMEQEQNIRSSPYSPRKSSLEIGSRFAASSREISVREEQYEQSPSCSFPEINVPVATSSKSPKLSATQETDARKIISLSKWRNETNSDEIFRPFRNNKRNSYKPLPPKIPKFDDDTDSESDEEKVKGDGKNKRGR